MADVSHARTRALAIATARAPDKTVCPSEVARSLSDNAGEWRDMMPIVHAAIDELLAEGKVQLSWKGKPLDTRAGPYRIRLKTSR